MVGFRCKYHGIVTLLARVGCSSTLQCGFKKRNSQELQLVQTRVLTWDDEIKSQWAKSPGYVFFFMHMQSFTGGIYFIPMHIVCLVHPLQSLLKICLEIVTNVKEMKSCLFKWWQRKVAWGYPGGGVLCDQTNNGFSLIKKEIESGPLNEHFYSGTTKYRWVDSCFSF